MKNLWIIRETRKIPGRNSWPRDEDSRCRLPGWGLCAGALLIALAPVLAGCSSMSSAAGYQATLDSWRGAKIDDMVRVWGPPEAAYTFDDKTKQYGWTRRKVVDNGYSVVPSFGFYGYGGRRHGGFGWGMAYPGWRVRDWGVYYGVCQTVVTTDAKGFITALSGRGNDCKLRMPGDPKVNPWVNPNRAASSAGTVPVPASAPIALPYPSTAPYPSSSPRLTYEPAGAKPSAAPSAAYEPAPSSAAPLPSSAAPLPSSATPLTK